MFLYNLLAWLLLPLAFVKLWWRGRKDPGYRQRWRERLTLSFPKFNKPVIWFHAVSVGETIAARPLIEALLSQYGDSHQVLLTNGTLNGSRCTQKLFGDRVQHCYLPYDVLALVKRFVTHIQPCLAMLMETEVWPNMMKVLNSHHIPVLLVNARLSDKSQRAYSRLAGFFKPVFASFSAIAAQAASDAARFVTVGADPLKVHVVGNVKFNLQVSDEVLTKAREWRDCLPHEKVWLAASTHEGEEELIFDAFQRVSQVLPQLRLWIAPRHPERGAAVIKQAEKYGLTVMRRSQMQAADLTGLAASTVMMIDSIGELLSFYAVADVAFVGGSLITRGGHNILEPAAVGTPIMVGPSMYNFATIFDQFQAAQALMLVQNSDDMVAQLTQLLRDPAYGAAVSQRASACFLAEQQALAAHMALIAPYLACQRTENR